MVISLGAGHQWKVEVISQQIGEEMRVTDEGTMVFLALLLSH